MEVARSHVEAASTEIEPLAGYHWVYDGYTFKLLDVEIIGSLMKRLVAATGLHAISPLTLHEKVCYITAFQLIAESHVSLHARCLDFDGWWVWIDIFSCKEFDSTVPLYIIEEMLGGKWEAHQAR